jgi:hypothetical protein
MSPDAPSSATVRWVPRTACGLPALMGVRVGVGLGVAETAGVAVGGRAGRPLELRPWRQDRRRRGVGHRWRLNWPDDVGGASAIAGPGMAVSTNGGTGGNWCFGLAPAETTRARFCILGVLCHGGCDSSGESGIGVSGVTRAGPAVDLAGGAPPKAEPPPNELSVLTAPESVASGGGGPSRAGRVGTGGGTVWPPRTCAAPRQHEIGQCHPGWRGGSGLPSMSR